MLIFERFFFENVSLRLKCRPTAYPWVPLQICKYSMVWLYLWLLVGLHLLI